MTNEINTIEDCLELLAGLKQGPKIQVNSSDVTIMHSIARQVFKGTALTDRQFAVMQEKLQSYKDQFTALGYNFDSAVTSLRQPLRSIDRDKYIKIVSTADMLGPDSVYESYKENWQWLKIRFPFNKSNIALLSEIINVPEYRHTKGTHEHYFLYTERNLISLLDRFSIKEFKIDQNILDMYTAAKEIENNSQNFLSGIYDLKLKNIRIDLQPYIDNELGQLNNNNLIQFVDRRFRFGLDYIDIKTPVTSIEKIAYRSEVTYHSKPSEESIQEVLTNLWNLKRFPMLVVLDSKHAEDQLYEMANYFRDIIEPKEQSVLFRLEEADAGFNQLIKDRKLNNWVDNNTKVVYTSNSKLPKIIVSNEWKPCVAFSYNSSMDKFVDSYIKFNCDLVVYREEAVSPFRRYSKLYG